MIGASNGTLRPKVLGLLNDGPAVAAVCTENVIRIDLVTEALNVGHDGRAALLLSDAAGVAVQAEESS
jgi:hypothetical protein